MQGVVLQSYGAGNGPDARKDILDLFKKASARGVLIVNITQCTRGKVTAAYAAGKALLDAGVIPGADMTPEAALLKLSYLLAKDDWDMPRKRRLIEVNLRGELTGTQPEKQAVYLSIVDKLSKTLKMSSDEEIELLQESLFPTLLCVASRNGDIPRLEKLVQAGADVKVGDYDGRTPLHIAVCEGHLNVVKFLIKKGALIHAKDRYGHTALDDALRFAHVEIIAVLMDNGGKLSLTHSKLYAYICNTILHEDERHLEAWYQAGADFNEGDVFGKTPLHLACVLGKKDRVSDLLKFGAKPEIADREGNTPMSFALQNDHIEVVALLQRWIRNHNTKLLTNNSDLNPV